MVAKAERSVGMDYGEIKAYIQIGPKVLAKKWQFSSEIPVKWYTFNDHLLAGE